MRSVIGCEVLTRIRRIEKLCCERSTFSAESVQGCYVRAPNHYAADVSDAVSTLFPSGLAVSDVEGLRESIL